MGCGGASPAPGAMLQWGSHSFYSSQAEAPRSAATGVELEVLEFTNSFRAEHRLQALRWHAGLAGIARKHAVAVAEGSAPFSHCGARERFQACSSRCINIAENLARSEGFGRGELSEATVKGWCESEGHRGNLLGPFDHCGIGWAASDNGVIFMTQLLALV